MQLGTFRDPEVLYEEEPEGWSNTKPVGAVVNSFSPQAQLRSPDSKRCQSGRSGPSSKIRLTNSCLTIPTTTRRYRNTMLAAHNVKHLTQSRQVRIRFGVPPKKGEATIACPVTMTNSRGTLAIQSHRTPESKPLHSADAVAWLDTCVVPK